MTTTTPPRTSRAPSSRPPIAVQTRGTTSGRVSAPASHRTDIQGLRAVAVLLVALAHARVGIFAGGFVGVDVFFVLSGFLITGLLLAEARTTSSVSLLEFYLRRARRILPAATLTLVVTDLASLFLLNFVHARAAVGDSVHAGAFSANFQFAARGVDYFAQTDPPSPFLHYWSLSVEEQFYLVWPLLFATLLFGTAIVRQRHGAARLQRHRRLLVVVVALAGLSLAWRCTRRQQLRRRRTSRRSRVHGSSRWAQPSPSPLRLSSVCRRARS
jgi:peptidoglycan/LPS O-acetylase OafA/YrhL